MRRGSRIKSGGEGLDGRSDIRIGNQHQRSPIENAKASFCVRALERWRIRVRDDRRRLAQLDVESETILPEGYGVLLDSFGSGRLFRNALQIGTMQKSFAG